MQDSVRVRFAPSPTGHLHLGNARTALFNWLYARNQNGKFILRLEDTDQIRSSVGSADAILKDLEWLGLFWDEGPGIGGNFGPYQQSERQSIYQKYANILIDKGLAYYCYCSAEKIEKERTKALAEHKLPKYNGHCLSLTTKQLESYKSEGRKPTVRLKVSDTSSGSIIISDIIRGQVKFESAMIGDFVLLRSEGLAAYNFAVVIDDALMGITHILRGEDHLSNTPKQILLYKALEFKIPKFAHLSMITGPDHSRLSKRHGATSVSNYREKGILPEALVNYLALLGWSSKDEKEFLSIDELVKKFSIKRLNKSAAVFDPKKLMWLNGNHIRSSTPDKIAKLAFGHIPDNKKNEWKIKIKEKPDGWWENVVASVQTKLETIDQIFDKARVYFDKQLDFNDDTQKILDDPLTKKVIDASLDIMDKQNSISKDTLFDLIKEISKQSDVKGKIFYMAIRVGLSGKTTGPELQDLIFLLGKDSCIDRFKQTKNYIEKLSSLS